MATIKFKGPKFTKLIQKAAAQNGRMPYTGKTARKPLLWLVKDSGAYLMPSNDPKKIGISEQDWPNYIVHAPGYGKNCDWDKQQRTWGGNDFVIDIDFPPKVLAAIKEGRTDLQLHLVLEGAGQNELSVLPRWFLPFKQ